jgi:hypothetical protein
VSQKVELLKSKTLYEQDEKLRNERAKHIIVFHFTNARWPHQALFDKDINSIAMYLVLVFA